MRFVHRVAVPANPLRTWSYILDVPAVARCVPGLEEVSTSAPDRYRGVLRITIGPVRLRLAGALTVASKDEAARAMRLHASAQDTGASGAVEADVELRVEDQPSGALIHIETDARIMGRIGEFGQPLIKRKADQTIAEFGRNLAAALSAPQA